MKQHFKTRLTVLFMILSIMLLCLGLAACGETKTYTVTVSETANGTVTLSPEAEGNKYEENAEVEVTVTPATGYEVDTFTVSTDAEAALTEGKYTLTVTADTTISATFKSTAPTPKFAVTVPTTVEHGEIDVSPAASDGKYTQGTEITVTLKPAQDYEVDTFTVGGEDKKAELDNNVYKFNITAETAITATFKPITKWYSITKNTPEHGTIDITPAAGESGKYAENTQITVTLSPETGYEVDTFTVGGDDKKAELEDNVYTFNITAETAIAAAFKKTEIPATAITGVPSQLALEIGEYNPTKKTYKLEPTVVPAESTDALSYEVDFDDIVSVADDGTLTALSVGDVTVTVRAGDVVVTCAVSVTNHVHSEEYAISTDGGQHHVASCKGCEWTQQEDCTVSTVPNTDAASGHHSECSKCHWQGEESGHNQQVTGDGATDAQHKLLCSDCGYYTWQRHDAGIQTDDSEHWTQCPDCGHISGRATHNFQYALSSDGTKHIITCKANGLLCPYHKEETHTADGAPVPKEDDPSHHHTKCSVCKLFYNEETHNGNGEVVLDSVKSGGETGHYMYCTCGAISDVTSPHTPGDSGKCTACGADCGTHEHDPIPDENGYYDGHCACGENAFFTVDENGVLALTEKGIPAEYTKIKIPEMINKINVTSFTGDSKGETSVFSLNEQITDIIIPQGITSLPSYGFYKCTNLSTVIILAQVTELPNNIFSGCTKLSILVLPQTLTTIANYAFGMQAAQVTQVLEKVYFMGNQETWTTLVEALKGQSKTLLSGKETLFYSAAATGSATEWHWKEDGVTPEAGPWGA